MAVSTGDGRVLIEARRQRLAAQQLHHHHQRALVQLDEVEDAHDAAMGETSGEVRLATEALERLLVLDLFVQHLEGDVATGHRVARDPDGAHAAEAERTVEPVLAGEHRADLQVETLQRRYRLGLAAPARRARLSARVADADGLHRSPDTARGAARLRPETARTTRSATSAATGRGGSCGGRGHAGRTDAERRSATDTRAVISASASKLAH